MADHADGLAAASAATPEQIEVLYDEWVTDYERDVIGWGYTAPTSSAERLAARLDPATAAVLDAGCGTGLTGTALAAAGFADVTGIDLSGDSLAHAAARGVYRVTRQVDLTGSLPFDDDVFDGLLCCGVLSYVPDLDRAFGEFVRVVRSGGASVCTQRTDLWDDRDTQGAIDRLVAAGRCTADVSDESPYLPHHPEFGAAVGIRYITITVT